MDINIVNVGLLKFNKIPKLIHIAFIVQLFKWQYQLHLSKTNRHLCLATKPNTSFNRVLFVFVRLFKKIVSEWAEREHTKIRSRNKHIVPVQLIKMMVWRWAYISSLHRTNFQNKQWIRQRWHEQASSKMKRGNKKKTRKKNKKTSHSV